MNPTNDRLRRELASGPLKRNGFDERLRRRIEERLDEEPLRRPFRPFRLAGAFLGVLVMIGAFLLLIRLHPAHVADNSRSIADSTAREPESGIHASAASDEPSRRSVLLLGLRRDEAEAGTSDYRTLLVSSGPDPSDWTAAEGDGIVMPYRIDFWKLDVGEIQAEVQPLRLAWAYNASRADKIAFPMLEAWQEGGESGPIEERILFAGNRYVALARWSSGTWMYRVTEVSELGQPRNLTAIAGGAERHVMPAVQPDGRLGVVAFDEPNRIGTVSEWRIERKAGRWTAMSRDIGAGPDGAAPTGSAGWRELPYPPGPEIVAHNELALSWDAIRAAQPAAVDAFTSPAHNMAAIVTDREIVFYRMKQGELEDEMLELPLRPGEKVIMAEWATHADYVDEWIRRVGAVFQGS